MFWASLTLSINPHAHANVITEMNFDLSQKDTYNASIKQLMSPVLKDNVKKSRSSLLTPLRHFFVFAVFVSIDLSFPAKPVAWTERYRHKHRIAFHFNLLILFLVLSTVADDSRISENVHASYYKTYCLHWMDAPLVQLSRFYFCINPSYRSRQ